jgi:hypothetical protein
VLVKRLGEVIGHGVQSLGIPGLGLFKVGLPRLDLGAGVGNRLAQAKSA